MQVQAIIVNYGTPDLTRRAVWSLLSLYHDLAILIVDNASPDDSVSRLSGEFERSPTVRISVNESNLHHGPAMDVAMRASERDWVLLFDSDAIAYRAGLVEGLLDTARIHSAYMVGDLCFVDEGGSNVDSAEV
ncbi:MAG: glycosyltransferase, partial [Rhodothermia bacterium]|nr:glycosyltransferase [Rhodothermia bacterium]